MTDRERLWHALPEADRASTAIEDIPAETIGAELCKALDDEGYGARYAAGIRLLTKRRRICTSSAAAICVVCGTRTSPD